MIEQRLIELGITLPAAMAPAANYVPFVMTGQLLYISGQVSFGVTGRLGDDLTVEQGTEAARLCAINLMAQMKAALGDLNRVVRVVRLGGFINSTPNFFDGPIVMNGASDLIGAVFGEKGRHARTTVGVASLPRNCAVEVDAIVEFAA